MGEQASTAEIPHEIRELSLATEGRQRIAWAAQEMPVLAAVEKRFADEQPLAGVRIGACLHVTTETANLIRVLKRAGAEIRLCASNPLSTQDDAAAAIVADLQVPVFAIRGEDTTTYYQHIRDVLACRPHITLDDGADFACTLHAEHSKLSNRPVILRAAAIHDELANGDLVDRGCRLAPFLGANLSTKGTIRWQIQNFFAR